MKYILPSLLLICIISIVFGYTLNVGYSKKLIGFGVLGLFFIVIPLFSWYRWKDRDPKEYMLTKENLDKMRKRESKKKNES